MRKMLLASSLMVGLMAVPSGMVLAAKAKAEPAKAKIEAAKEKAGAANSAEAETPPQAPIVGRVEAGRKIYENICFHCHRLDYQASEVGAPGLRDVTHRHDIEWIEQWITSPRAFAKIDPSAKALVASNPYGLTMPTLPEMQDPQNRADIIAFLKTLEDKDNNQK
jgi:cytochrome c2